jgi:hypothetical protein
MLIYVVHLTYLTVASPSFCVFLQMHWVYWKKQLFGVACVNTHAELRVAVSKSVKNACGVDVVDK